MSKKQGQQAFKGMPKRENPKKKSQRQQEVEGYDRGEFVERLHAGWRTELAVAGALERYGFDAQVCHAEGRVTVPRSEQQDIIVDKKVLIEVKGKVRAIFHGPWDYPYPTVFVGRYDRWRAQSIRPHAIVVVSEPTGAMIGAWLTNNEARTIPPDWVVTPQEFDRGEQSTEAERFEQAYMLGVPRRRLVKWTTFVQRLRERVR